MNNPVPTLTSIDPETAAAGGSTFTLTVTGSRFVSSSRVRWKGSDKSTTFQSSTQLTASISASDIADGGSAEVTVFNPAPGGGTSAGVTFTIENGVPTIGTLSPASGFVGSQAFQLTVNGTTFVAVSVVRWNASDRTTTFVSKTQLRAAILATDVAAVGAAQVTVFNPAPAGGTSSAANFSILAPGQLAVTTSRFPASAVGKAYAFRVAAAGGVPNPTDPEDNSYTWSISPGSLPASLTLDSATGRIQGTITSGAGTSNFTVQVSDFASTPNTASRPLSITVQSALARNDSTAGATAISNGTLRGSISPYGDQDFYAFDATAGATVKVEITARRLVPESQLDSVIEILDGAGNRPATCRSPDFPRDPGDPFLILDPTPTAFDDECRSDDQEIGVAQDPLLEFRPASPGTFYIRVIDFSGGGRPELLYDLSLSGAN